MTTLRPMKDGDRQKADALVKSAKAAKAPYQDYVQGSRGTEGGVLWSGREVRPARIHHHRGRMRGGRRGISCAYFWVDGSRLPL